MGSATLGRFLIRLGRFSESHILIITAILACSVLTLPLGALINVVIEAISHWYISDQLYGWWCLGIGSTAEILLGMLVWIGYVSVKKAERSYNGK